MSEQVKLDGIVVKSAPLGDNGKMITVLTRERGVVSIAAKGVKSLKNKNAPGVMPLCYSTFFATERGDVYSLSSAEVIESFYSLRENLEALSYGVYFAQLAAFIVGRGVRAADELRLVLNALYLLGKNPERCKVICCAFELKICEYAGIAPYVEACACGGEGVFFDVAEGECVCAAHKTENARKMSPSAKAVIEYVQNADLKKALLFDTPSLVAEEVSSLVRQFLTRQMGDLPKSLDYIKKINID